MFVVMKGKKHNYATLKLNYVFEIHEVLHNKTESASEVLGHYF